ncbi:TPA: hypothetical protein ACJI8U_001528 [Morganella morganii]
MTDNKRLAGDKLDKLIESELLAMVREGLEQSPIKPASLHKRLVIKGYVSGGLSTLSTPKRKALIQQYQKRQLNQMNLTSAELDVMVEGRRANEGYRTLAQRMKKERDDMARQLDLNTRAVLDIINAVDLLTPIKVEDFLSQYLIRELALKNNGL